MTPKYLDTLLAAGVFGFIYTTTLYAVGYFRQSNRDHAFERNLKRLSRDLTVLKRNLESLMREGGSKSKKRTSTSSFNNPMSLNLNTLKEMEFADLTMVDRHPSFNLDGALKDIDDKLNIGSMWEIEFCLATLQELAYEHPESPHLMWRIAKAHYKLAEQTSNKKFSLQCYNRGIEACQRALNMVPELADVHKWLAILVGKRSEFHSDKQKYKDKRIFKKHIGRALQLNPNDLTLHHLMMDQTVARAFKVFGMNRYEKKILSTLCAGLGVSTICDIINLSTFGDVVWIGVVVINWFIAIILKKG